jgi:hypothetical protein
MQEIWPLVFFKLLYNFHLGFEKTVFLKKPINI